ncbi:Peroxisomal membrane signal receptor PTS1 [Malassezia obtusa]|uniref:Peroxisomal membrane signal receptor PTS1 n=1 Tax=Malassezia obtusa TaxID=76774 RepID=A0AAF0E6T9_9BASI|nr:Peroxisomal membrane signal receptor PTS1 [Malassezia obtusa]
MAFQSMLSGAECSTSNNTLSQFLKHSQTDRSLQQDSMQPGAPPGGMQQRPGFRTRPAGGAAPEMDAFLRQGGGGGHFDMHAMRAEMDSMRAAPTAHQPMARPAPSAWAQEMHRQSAGAPAAQARAPAPHAWSEQFHAQGPAGPAHAPAQHARGEPWQASRGMPMGMPFHGGLGMGMRAPMQAPGAAREQRAERFVELDDAQWEEQFRRLEESTAQKGKGRETESAAAEAQEPAQDAEQEERERLREFQERLGPTFRDKNPRFEELWNTLKDPNLHAQNDDLAKWEEQLMQAIAEEDPSQSTHPGGGLGPGELGLNELDGLGDEEASLRNTLNEVDERGFPVLGDYVYAQANPFAQHATPFAEGVRLLENNGSLTDAALLFEAATQRDAEPYADEEIERTNEERSRAWQKLGECQAMNEHEEQAIQALERALDLDHNNLEAYLSLAVSYINEGYDAAANATLLKYLAHTHPHLAPSSEFPVLPDQNTNPWARLNYVRDLFLKAARENAASGQMDPEVQIALGVLFYSSSSYDQARDCFQAALESRPDDFQLWNRLGATLANGGNPELATEAYHKALELRPTFTRAIYNLSVSCLNLGAHHQAAEHLLSALTLQRSEPIPDAPDGPAERAAPPLAASKESESLWSTLRSIFVVLNRLELANACHVGSDLAQFREAGFDF